MRKSWRNRPAAMGERTAFCPQTNSTACGRRDMRYRLLSENLDSRDPHPIPPPFRVREEQAARARRSKRHASHKLIPPPERGRNKVGVTSAVAGSFMPVARTNLSSAIRTQV